LCIGDCCVVDVPLFGVPAILAHVRLVDSMAPAVMPSLDGSRCVFFVVVECGLFDGGVPGFRDGLGVEAVDVRIVEVFHQVLVGLIFLRLDSPLVEGCVEDATVE
jgi:hypothetical protein